MFAQEANCLSAVDTISHARLPSNRSQAIIAGSNAKSSYNVFGVTGDRRRHLAGGITSVFPSREKSALAKAKKYFSGSLMSVRLRLWRCATYNAAYRVGAGLQLRMRDAMYERQEHEADDCGGGQRAQVAIMTGG